MSPTYVISWKRRTKHRRTEKTMICVCLSTHECPPSPASRSQRKLWNQCCGTGNPWSYMSTWRGDISRVTCRTLDCSLSAALWIMDDTTRCRWAGLCRIPDQFLIHQNCEIYMHYACAVNDYAINAQTDHIIILNSKMCCPALHLISVAQIIVVESVEQSLLIWYSMTSFGDNSNSTVYTTAANRLSQTVIATATNISRAPLKRISVLISSTDRGVKGSVEKPSSWLRLYYDASVSYG